MKRIKNSVQFILQCSRSESERSRLKSKLKRLKDKLQGIANSIDLEEPKYTGWYVLLKKEKNGWKSKCFHPNSEDSTDDYEIILPIPEPNSLPEFDGF